MPKMPSTALQQENVPSVKTWGASQQGNFVYEWGQAEAAFNGGTNVIDKYLTVWQLQADGSWKIFRNMVIPDK
jgi:ketosteroid isomerase-like protein